MEHSTPQIYTEFLPISRADMEARGWDQLDFVVVGGDAYVDHPSFGTAIISRLLEAEGYQVLMNQYNMTQEETAQRVGKSRSAVANALRLLNLCPPVRAMVEDGRLTNGHARALLPLSPALQEKAADAILKSDLSVRQTELLACHAFSRPDGTLARPDLVKALNRLSSLCWILMIRVKRGGQV